MMNNRQLLFQSIKVVICTLLVGGLQAASCNSTVEPDPNTLQVKCTTSEASDIGSTSATFNGSVTISNAVSSGGQAFFYYSDTESSAKSLKSSGIKVSAGSISNNGGTFSFAASNLAPSVKYHFLAAVTIDNQEFFGDVKSFMTSAKPKELIASGSVSNITETKAVITGYANPTPDLGSVKLGILISKDPNPSLDNGKVFYSVELDGNQMFSITATDLSPNTVYYFKAFIEYGGIYRYGETKSFTTKALNVRVQSLEVSNVGLFECMLNGRVIVDNKELDKRAWFLYGAKTNTLESLISAGNTVSATMEEDDSFAYHLSDLQAGESYYYVACCRVLYEVFYGDVLSFTTHDYSARVNSLPASNIGLFSVSLNGNVSTENADGLSVFSWFLCSSTATTLEEIIKTGSYIPCNSVEKGVFSAEINDLSPGTTYYYVAVSQVNDRVYYGDISSFTTLDYSAAITLLPATDIGLFSGTINGRVEFENADKLNKQAWIIYSSDYNSFEELQTSGMILYAHLQDNGVFSVSLSDLSLGTTYYYVLCVKVHERVYYSTINSFDTDKLMVSNRTISATTITPISAILEGGIEINNKELLPVSVCFLYSASAETLDQLISYGDIADSSMDDNGHYSVNLQNLTGGRSYCYVARARVYDTYFYGDVKRFTTSKFVVGDAIDLGLSVKWSSLNIGASSPDEIGVYFAWGEVLTKAVYSWKTYKWCNGLESSLLKYNYESTYGVVDYKTILDESDDAAHVGLGGKWRTPTLEECHELMRDCTWTKSSYNGVAGYCITSNSNGNSIFIPANGFVNGTEITDFYVGGHFWTSSLYDKGSLGYSWNMGFNSSRAYRMCYPNFWTLQERCSGLPIRPVCDY